MRKIGWQNLPLVFLYQLFKNFYLSVDNGFIVKLSTIS